MITVFCENNQNWSDYKFGTNIQQIAQNEGIELPHPILGALVNNKVRDLSYRIHKPCQISFFDITSDFGNDMYKRSLYFLLYKVVNELYPEATLKILHSIAGGKYCEIDNLSAPLSQQHVSAIKEKMQEYIHADLPYRRIELPTNQALEEYQRHGLTEKANLFKYRKRIYTSIYGLGDTINYYYGFLIPSTGYITIFNVELYEKGLLLKLPSQSYPDSLSATYHLPKLFAIYQEYKKWALQLGVPYVTEMNDKVFSGEVGDIIKITEAYHEKKFAQIADEIFDHPDVKMILISGPSSSGKTTTCKRLSIQLAILGYDPVQISVDDFFVERVNTPKDEKGEYDFESIDAIDLELFNSTLLQLMDENEVQLPTFDFVKGSKIWNGKRAKMKPKSILIIEGIHCLNPKLTEKVSDDLKYKVFVSALTSISIDSQNPIPTTDNRLIRRMIRDYQYRGYSALDTLRRWHSVRNGENKNIFPYQENADVMFNTALIYELGILKPYALPILREVPETEPEYAEARRLLKFLSYFKTISTNVIPGTSILREFVGGSQFHY